MKRPLGTILIAIVLVSAMPDAAQTAQKTGRYVLKQTSDGFMRLDTQSGSIAHCVKRNSKWQCDNLVGGNADTLADIAKLERQNKELIDRVAGLEARVRSLTMQNTSPRTKLELPDDQELDEIMGFFEKLVSRLMRFARTLQDAPGKDI